MGSRDKYRNIAELAATEREGRDFRRVVITRDSRIVVIAPHGGGIERGTSEIATALAGAEYSLYCFEGLKHEGNYESLHITSTNFDDPVCVQMVEQSGLVLAVHGCEGNEGVVFVGGRNDRMKGYVLEALQVAGFKAVEDFTSHSGREAGNICNRGGADGGVQLEIAEGLRRSMFQGLSRAQRRVTTPVFDRFVDSIRTVLPKAEVT
jgi:phage replication-related protein YjqB (UPF0714/DUF867 family)